MNEQSTLRAMRAGFRVLGAVHPLTAARLATRLFFRPRRFDRPAREQQLVESGTPLELRCGLRATQWGESGPTVLLVHGWEGRGTQLGAFAGPLAAAGLRVVALDGPAHGDSPGSETNLLEFGRALVAVERELGPLEAVVAHSFGCASTLVATDIGLRPRRLVFIAGPASVPDVVRRFAAMLTLSPRVEQLLFGTVAARVGRRAEDLDLLRFASRLTIPTLLIHDEGDAEVPYRDALALDAAWPAATLRTVTGLGHRRILRDPTVVADAVRFVTSGRHQEATPLKAAIA